METHEDAEEDVEMAGDAIVSYQPSTPARNEAFVNQTSGSLLRALRELKRVDEILQVENYRADRRCRGSVLWGI